MALADFPNPRVFWRWLRQWRKTNMVDKIDRVAVLSSVEDAGAMGARFAFMTLMACGIATLGLLQNSVAVIIGAMLIAPLMGPIIELGMGLATFDFRTVREALKTLAVGIVLALVMAMLLVWFSPLKQATPEILARTQPTFFDLLVAIFSGLAGAYATITRKGEAIVGVAIATALMPPLAVVAYGLALGNWSIAGGAGMLFMTNMLAIALSVTVVARLYGFGGSDSPKQTAWQAGLIIGTFVLLSIPLGLSLQRIARQSQAEIAIRSALDQAANNVQGRVSALRVETVNDTMVVDAVLMTPRFVHGLDQKLSQQLSAQLGRKIDVELREVVTTDDQTLSNQQATLSELSQSITALQQAERTRDGVIKTQQDAQAMVNAALAAHVGTIENGPGDNMLTLRLKPAAGLDLAQSRALEQQLTTALEAMKMQVQVVPPLRGLPPLPVNADGTLDTAAAQALDTQAWALQRWDVAAIDCVGFARDSEEARKHADAVAAILRRRGIVVGDARAADSADRRAAPDNLRDAVWLRLPAD
ncbi:MAG: TIGR00341 family protein [Xanthomonadaceae bacterium]|nr:TIGR00341 family protein [Xanthomonadaceae bacterium]